MSETAPWWQHGVIYQLLVPSYFDTNGDGMGDIPGVSSKLEYLQWLGVDAVWLSPIYGSPFEELGYDVSDYTGVNPRFGALEDFDALVREAHDRGLKVILDWVPNHTSSEHPWFKESRSSRDNPKRDWYIWRDPKPDGSPPNNWLSIFGGDVWEFDEATGQYYLHTFLEQQPDLNWHNPEVEEAILDAMRFWLDRGVDGFRLDALDLLVKDDQFRDNPPNPDYDPAVTGPDMVVLPVYTRDQPGVHRVVADMRRLIDEYGDRLLAGELYLDIQKIVGFYGKEVPELHLPLNPVFGSLSWSAQGLHEVIEQYMDALPERGWPCWMMSTHDGKRVASRAGNEQAGVAAMMLLTLRGTPVIYYGDEIGMHDVEIPPEKEVDPQGKRIGRKRDPVRTPMQWNAMELAGFSAGEPWLPVAEDYEHVNVNVQSEESSLLTLYRQLLDLRRNASALAHGRFELGQPDEHLLSYMRISEDERLLILLNFSPESRAFRLPEAVMQAVVRLSTKHDRLHHRFEGTVQVQGNEGLILSL